MDEIRALLIHGDGQVSGIPDPATQPIAMSTQAGDSGYPGDAMKLIHRPFLSALKDTKGNG